jgi:hypothetical protein
MWSATLSIEKTPICEVRVYRPDKRREGTRGKGDSPLAPKPIPQDRAEIILPQDRNDVFGGDDEKI